MPLRGTSRLTLTTSGPPAGSPSRARAAPRSAAVEGVIAPSVDAGRDLDHRRPSCPARRAGASSAG